jgi:cellulose synthase/poly-beta-1,6-N-acetylglucosamine synthase-like glycosyltransferase
MPSLFTRTCVVLVGLLTTGLAIASAVALVPTLHGSMGAALVGMALGVGLLEAVTLLALGVAMLRTRSPLARVARPVSVLVAAWNERDAIVQAVRGLLAQAGVQLEVIVADDGSTDGTGDRVEQVFGSDARVRLVRIEHAGKGAALEAARAVARFPRIATVDADTRLEPLALAKLVGAIDGDVVAAGGAVLIDDASNLGRRFQALEYLRTTWVRAAWAELGMLEQIPGAFSAFDAAALASAGGFPTDSITEDYEISYRLYEDAARHHRKVHIALVPEARAFTAPPHGFGGFLRQRTRWFAGFLSTLVRFRRLILSPLTGRFGMVRLPLKVLDSVGPLLSVIAMISLAVLLVRGEALSLLVLLPLLVRALADVVIFLAARAMAPTQERGAASILLTAIDAMTYGVVRQLVVLRAYPFAARRLAIWERSREPRTVRAARPSASISHPEPAE